MSEQGYSPNGFNVHYEGLHDGETEQLREARKSWADRIATLERAKEYERLANRELSNRIGELERDLTKAQAAVAVINDTAREYYNKAGIAETLADKHPAMVVRQAAAEILRLRAEVERYRADAERGRWMIKRGEWWRDGAETRLVIRVADYANLSCEALRQEAIDAARSQP